MQTKTLLFRQVHPTWFKNGHVMSIAFRPFPKDEGLLSVYDGDQLSPEKAWGHYTGTLGHASAGVWAVSVGEAEGAELPSRAAPLQGFAEHAVIDFTKHGRKQQEAKSKILAALAEDRGYLHLAPVAGGTVAAVETPAVSEG